MAEWEFEPKLLTMMLCGLPGILILLCASLYYGWNIGHLFLIYNLEECALVEHICVLWMESRWQVYIDQFILSRSHQETLCLILICVLVSFPKVFTLGLPN